MGWYIIFFKLRLVWIEVFSMSNEFFFIDDPLMLHSEILINFLVKILGLTWLREAQKEKKIEQEQASVRTGIRQIRKAVFKMCVCKTGAWKLLLSTYQPGQNAITEMISAEGAQNGGGRRPVWVTHTSVLWTVYQSRYQTT